MAQYFIQRIYGTCRKRILKQKIDINIYDAIEKIYKMSHYKIANILGVTIGVINYAHIRGTPKKKN